MNRTSSRSIFSAPFPLPLGPSLKHKARVSGIYVNVPGDKNPTVASFGGGTSVTGLSLKIKPTCGGLTKIIKSID